MTWTSSKFKEAAVNPEAEILAALPPELQKKFQALMAAKDGEIEEKDQEILHDDYGFLNRKGFTLLGNTALKAADTDRNIGITIVDATKFKQINDKLDHKTGDTAIAAIGAKLSNIFGEPHIVGHIGGDEFAIMTFDLTKKDIDLRFDMLSGNIVVENTAKRKKVSVELSHGTAFYNGQNNISDMMGSADEKMYAHKETQSRPSQIYDIDAKITHAVGIVPYLG